MRAFVEILGPGTPDSSSSIQLFFNEGRYLFECGDGTQRLCTEYGIRLARLRGIFLTSLSAPSIGGLLGLNLTLADAGKQAVSITAPHGLSAIFNAARPFYYRPSLISTIRELDLETRPNQLPIPVSEDEYLSISAVPVRSRRDIDLDTAFGAHYDAVAYICRLLDLRGKFNPKKALSLGVKKGPNFGLLQKGQSVTTDVGTVVTPEDVMSPSTPGPVVLVVPCPSVHHVQSITDCEALSPIQLDVLKEDAAVSRFVSSRVCVIVHLCPRSVLDNMQYQQWCDAFGASVTHIPLHSSVSPCRATFSAQAEDISVLHFTVDKNLFPLPSDAFEPSAPNSILGAANAFKHPDITSSDTISASDEPEPYALSKLVNNRVGKWIEGDCRLKFILSPTASAGPDRTSVRPRFLKRKPNQALRPWSDTAIEQVPELETQTADLKTPSCIASLPPRTAGVRFFGTGAAIPGKHRNVSGLMIDMFERGGVMMDCGEGTWGQMVRHFGAAKAKRVLCDLKVIFISHMHADHHLGLITLLHERTAAMQEQPEYCHGPQLVLVGPRHLASWLEAFQAAAKVPLRDKLPPYKRSFKFFDASSLTDPQAPEAKFFPDALGLELGCVDVIHCPLSYGVVLRDCVHGWKVVYSGDTRPCSALGEVGRGATLAIHEATLDDEMEAEAIEKAHCTTSEALDVCANQMGAWRTILTHFSQRYPKIPKLSDETVEQMRRSRAVFSFDLMFVDFSRLKELPRVVPALRDCFPEENMISNVREPIVQDKCSLASVP